MQPQTVHQLDSFFIESDFVGPTVNYSTWWTSGIVPLAPFISSWCRCTLKRHTSPDKTGAYSGRVRKRRSRRLINSSAGRLQSTKGSGKVGKKTLSPWQRDPYLISGKLIWFSSPADIEHGLGDGKYWRPPSGQPETNWTVETRNKFKVITFIDLQLVGVISSWEAGSCAYSVQQEAQSGQIHPETTGHFLVV